MVTSERMIQPGDCVLVTGAAGGVGQHVVRALLDGGCIVRAVDQRGGEDLPLEWGAERTHVEWVQCDLRHAPLDALMEGVRAVIHTAALVGLSESYEEHHPTNVELVARLYQAAGRVGVEQFIHFGAGSVYRPGKGLRVESDEIEPSNDYERTKVESEAILRSQEEGPAWTILRPASIYGPACESMSAGLVTLPPLLRSFIKYVPAFTGGIRGSWCHVEDVASAAMVVLGNPRAYGQVFNVADDTPLGLGEVMTSITQAYGLEIGPLVPFPSPPVLFAFSPLVDRDQVAFVLRQVLRQLWGRLKTKHFLNTPLRPKVDRRALFYAAADTVLDSSALKGLGWGPRWPDFQEGIVDTIQWYQEQRWVPRFDTEAQVRVAGRRQLGFSFSQTLTGDWTDEDGSRHPMQLTMEVEFPRLGRVDLSGRFQGRAWLTGLAVDAELRGTIRLGLSRRCVRYEFGVDTDEGGYRGTLRAHLDPRRPIESLSWLQGELFDDRGHRCGSLGLGLDVAEDLVPLLLSVRPV